MLGANLKSKRIYLKYIKSLIYKYIIQLRLNIQCKTAAFIIYYIIKHQIQFTWTEKKIIILSS